MGEESRPGLHAVEMVLLWVLAVVWVAVFLGGTLVNSEPYREQFAAFEGGVAGMMADGLAVLVTYTLTNVGALCVLAGVLGQLGAKAILVADKQRHEVPPPDTTSPKSSAVLRSFLVYLTFLAGVLVFGDAPATPTQEHYVRLAGAMSLVAFVVNYRPTLFAQVLERGSRVFAPGQATPAAPKEP